MVNIDVNNMPEPMTRLESYLQIIIKSLKKTDSDASLDDFITITAGGQWGYTSIEEDRELVKNTSSRSAYTHYGEEKVNALSNGIPLTSGNKYTFRSTNKDVLLQVITISKTTGPVKESEYSTEYVYTPTHNDELAFINFKIRDDGTETITNKEIDETNLKLISESFNWLRDAES